MKTKKEHYSNLLSDNTPVAQIDTSLGGHELGDLARLDGHASLSSCLNDSRGWGRTVAEVAQWLIGSKNPH